MITTGDMIKALKRKLEDPIVDDMDKLEILDFFTKHNRLIWEKIDVEAFFNDLKQLTEKE